MVSRSRWAPLLAAFTIWFLHFMVCWAASELIWPRERPALTTAWVATALALAALALLAWRQHRRHAAGAVAGWHDRFARAATALAAVGVVFSLLPALVLTG